MQPIPIQSVIDKPIFTPTYLNMEYVFSKILDILSTVYNILSNPHTWNVLGIISSLLSIIFITIIIFSLVRLRELQIEDKEEVDRKIFEALLRDKENDRSANPRWHYILTLIESPNESDWRVAIIEADTMMEELLKKEGFSGATASELLEAAKLSGYINIQNAWDAHIVRNQIAHKGLDFPISQVEGRRVIKMYQTFFEDLRAI